MLHVHATSTCCIYKLQTHAYIHLRRCRGVQLRSSQSTRGLCLSRACGTCRRRYRTRRRAARMSRMMHAPQKQRRRGCSLPTGKLCTLLLRLVIPRDLAQLSCPTSHILHPPESELSQTFTSTLPLMHTGTSGHTSSIMTRPKSSW